MSAPRSCCSACSRRFYSCDWADTPEPKRGRCGRWLVALASLLALGSLYVFLVTSNDKQDVNEELFKNCRSWVNWFMVLTIIFAVIGCYCLLLLVFILIQAFLGELLDLHWLHKIFLFLGLVLITINITAISVKWNKAWSIVSLSLQATGPFLQFGAVAALTLLSWFVFQSFHRTNKAGSKLLIAVVFGAASAAIFMCPCFIRSPCLIPPDEIPDKPRLIAHRGAVMLAPENTMMSFNRSIGCGAMAFETDVQLSKDRTPFLMHDHVNEFLLRTTNVKEVFPNQTFNSSAQLAWKDLQRLNAGEWFVKTDPFNTVSQLSEEEKQAAKNQTIPSLEQLLDLAKKHNISVLFDLYNYNHFNDTKDVVETIRESGIDPGLILWLPPSDRQWVKDNAPGFIHYHNKEKEVTDGGGRHLNMNYNDLSTQRIRELRSQNVTVNLWVVNERWLFSLLWCAGASSVTTNACHLLSDMERPDWTMKPSEYQITWILVDVASLLIMIGLYFIQRSKHCHCHRSGKGKQRKNTAAWNETQLLTNSVM